MTPRPFLAVLALATLLAGCAAPAGAPDEAAGAVDALAAATPPSPTVVEGTAWLPPSDGEGREETRLEFEVAAPRANVTVSLRLGERYVVELPATASDVQVQLVHPEGDTLAEGQLDGQSRETTLGAEALGAGTYAVVLLSYGGSDGSSMGGYVAYRIEVA